MAGPGGRRDGRRERRRHEGLRGDAVGRDRAARVEAVPADPQHSGADHREHQAVGIERSLPEAPTLAENEAEHERRPPRRHVHDRSAREVDGVDRRARVPDAVHHSIDAPDHVGEREVDEDHPPHDERHDRGVFHSLGDGAHDERRRDDREHELVHREDALRHPGAVVGVRRGADAVQERVLQPAQHRRAAREDHAVAEEPPEDRHDARAAEALRHHRQHVLPANEPAVEQRQPRKRHEEHERGRRHHPGVVAGPGRRERLRRGVRDVRFEIGHASGEVRWLAGPGRRGAQRGQQGKRACERGRRGQNEKALLDRRCHSGVGLLIASSSRQSNANVEGHASPVRFIARDRARTHHVFMRP